MNVVDSSAWVEYFVDGANAGKFAAAVEDAGELIVSTISIYEVFKWALREQGEAAALRVAGVMQQGDVVAVGPELAIAAAQAASKHGLAMADSMILATAQQLGATLWTQDSDFAAVPGVRYWPKAETGKSKR